MKRLIALLAAGMLLFSGIPASAETAVSAYPDRDYEELTVGNPTRMDGKFFTGMWGNATTDIDVRTLVHAYYLVSWGYDTGFFRANPVVCAAQGVFEDQQKTRIYRFQLMDDLYYSDGTEITAWDYAFSVLFQIAPEIAELGGRPMDLSYLEGYEEYISGEVPYLSGVRVTDDRMIEFRVKPEALPYFFELYRLGFLPYPIHEIAPGCRVYDDGKGVYIGNEDREVTERIFTRELLEATVMDPDSGYLSHPTVGSGPYTITSWDSETCTCTFEINPYFKGNTEGFKPTIPKLRFTLARDEDMVEKLEKDEFQLLNKVVRRDTIDKGMNLVSSGKGYTMTNYPRIGLTFIVFTPDSPEVQAKNVRQAIAYCMDKNAMRDEYTYLYGIPMDGMIGIGQWMYGMVRGTEAYPESLPEDPTPEEEAEYDERIGQWESLSLDGVKHYEPDIGKASRLLDADGWTMNEQGKRFREGQDDVRCKIVQGKLLTLDLTCAYPESNEMAEEMEKSLVQPLREAGIRLTLVPMEMNDLVHAYHDREMEGIDMFYVGDDFNIEFDPQLFFLPGDPKAPAEDSLAWVHAQMYEYARLMCETMPDDALGFVQKWITFQEKLSELLPLIPVYSNVYYDFYTSDLMNYDIIQYITWGDAIVASSYYNVYQSMVDRGIDPSITEDEFELLP